MGTVILVASVAFLLGVQLGVLLMSLIVAGREEEELVDRAEEAERVRRGTRPRDGASAASKAGIPGVV